MTLFLRLMDVPVDEKASVLRALAQGEGQERVFEREPGAFKNVPGSPFSYWVSEGVHGVFRRLPGVEGDGRTAKQGLATADDFRFLRAYWEVLPSAVGERWFGLAKGGGYSPVYSDVFLVIGWGSDGTEMKAWAGTLYNGSHWSRILKNTHLYFRPGLTWPLRTQVGFGIRAMPRGCIFSHKGPAAFVKDDDPEQLLALLAITTSRAFCYLVELQMAFGSYEVGVIQRTPVPTLTAADTQNLATLARRAWSLKRSLDTRNETSHAFLLPPGLHERLTRLDPKAVLAELAQIQRSIDALAFQLYGISAEDQKRIEEASQKRGAEKTDADDDAQDEDEDEDEENDAAGDQREALLSWLVGVAFGRFDPRLATGERPLPQEPEPFDALPRRSPGMFPEGEEPRRAPDILVDDEGHPQHLPSLMRTSAERVGVEIGAEVGAWLRHEFFPLHVKMYSKSRRKAPIYWQLATPSASYSVWLYVHAFSKDTLFRVQNDYVAPKLAHEERKLEAMRRETGEKATAAQRKELGQQQSLVEELRSFLDEIKRVAPLWSPNLDDGVRINFAPLYRLVAHQKPWQKELRAAWDGLCAGEYDWAHLAMHLFPERVVEQCQKDRSLAIAHGLEDELWAEGGDGKWTARKTLKKPVEELIRERTSSAVKAALQSLLDAQGVGAGSKKGKKGKG